MHSFWRFKRIVASSRTLWVLAASAMTASCTVGPAYRPPAAPAATRYTARPVAAHIAGAPAASGPAAGAQALEQGATVPPQWWIAFGSQALDQLIDQALKHNPDLATAQATLEQARYQARAAQGVFYPQVSLDLGAQRTRGNGAANGQMNGPLTYDVYTGQALVTYFPDAFGLNRLVARSEQAQVDVARHQLEAARLTIIGNVIAATLDLASLHEQITALAQMVADQAQLLDLVHTQFSLGAIAQSDVLTQESLLAGSRAQLTQLHQARDEARHRLAIYLGSFPAEAGRLDTPALDDLTLPASLPVSLPSSLIHARPDILAAEAQLRAANAQVGAAVARMYPSLQISAAFGGQNNVAGQLFDPAGQIWNLAAGIAAPLFEGGTLRARKQAAEAAYRGMVSTYQATVLQAFRNVADVLRALEHDAAFLQAQAQALQAAQQALALVRTEFKAGSVNYLALLTSQTQYQSARIAYAKARAQRYSDTAGLYLALGGDTWDPAPAGGSEPRTKAPGDRPEQENQ